MNEAQQYLDELARLPHDTFDHHFGETSARLGLGELFDRNELKLLYEASWRGLLCKWAISGIGKPEGHLKPEDEPERRQLEQEFMEARELFYASPGWQTLGELERRTIGECFLSLLVPVDLLAW